MLHIYLPKYMLLGKYIVKYNLVNEVGSSY